MSTKSVKMRLSGGAALVAALMLSSGALAADDSAEPSQNTTINLIRLLVKQHVISQQSANELLKEAEGEAAQARSKKKTHERSAAEAQAAQPTPPEPAAGVVRVPYVPEIVKNRIRDEVRDEVMAQAKAENWAQPNQLPAWLRRFEFFGDFRFRDEFDLRSQNNSPQYIDFQSFNANGPTDINPVTNPNGIPFLNTQQSRLDLLQIRARFGFHAQINDMVKVGFRLATGTTDVPIPNTQLLGGNLDKDYIWLDQSYVDIQPFKQIGFTAGRMPDPFVHTNLLFDENLNFDGVDAHFDTNPSNKKTVGLFGLGGFFPIEYISNNFPTFSTTKNESQTKYLGAGQVGVDWQATNFDWKTSTAYYDFHGFRGELSSPCALYNGNKQCSTDNTAAGFLQKGNTLFLIRDILPNPSSPLEFAQPQLVGLAFDYKIFDLNSTFTMKLNNRYDVQFQADYVRNTDYDPKDAYRYAPLGEPVNNLGPTPKGQKFGALQSGPNGYQVQTTIGDLLPREQWQWNVYGGYRYLQPDAVLDAFTYADFHLGGTNAKGYFIGGSVAVYDDTWFTARWLSADQVYGAPLAIDVLELDLTTAF